MTKVGDVIVNKAGRHVIMSMANGQVLDTEVMEKYIVENTLIPYNGEHRTIEEIIEIESNEYLKLVETITE